MNGPTLQEAQAEVHYRQELLLGSARKQGFFGKLTRDRIVVFIFGKPPVRQEPT